MPGKKRSTATARRTRRSEQTSSQDRSPPVPEVVGEVPDESAAHNGGNGRRRGRTATAEVQRRAVDEITGEVAFLRDRLEQTGAEVGQTVAQAQALQAECAVERERLAGMLGQADLEMHALLEQLSQARDDLRRMQQLQTDTEDEVWRTLRKAQSLLEEIEAVRQRADAPEQPLQELHGEMAQLREGLDAVRRDVTEAQRQMEEALLEQQIRDLPPAGAASAQPAAVSSAVPQEPDAERLLRHLNHAWAVEISMTDALQEMVEQAADPAVSAELGRLRQIAQRQQTDLAERLRALGKEPSGGKGLFQRLFGHLWNVWHREADERDRTLLNLFKGISSASYEAAMYQALAALAEGTGDAVTAEIARRHLNEKREASEALWRFLPTSAPPLPPPEPVAEPVSSPAAGTVPD